MRRPSAGSACLVRRRFALKPAFSRAVTRFSAMKLASLSACSAGVSSGWESAVGAGAVFFGEEPGGVLFWVAEGTVDVLPETALGELREDARLGTRPLRTSSSKSLT